MTNKISILILNLVFIVYLISCGGGGGDDSKPQPDSISNNYSGRIFIGNNGYGSWILDLTTGHYSKIPGVEWDDNDDYHHSAEFSAFPSFGGQEFVETIEECEYLGSLTYNDCIVIHDSEGEIVSSFKVPNQTYGPAKLSRDRMFVAVPIRDPASALNPIRLAVYTRDGVYIDTTSSGHDINSKGFDWLPDNRLVYAADRELFVTTNGSAESQLFGTFTEEQGVPDHLAVSPDGKRLALTLKTFVTLNSTHGTVWVLDLDATKFIRLAKTPDEDNPNTTTDDPVINFPMWSPNGQWIAVIEGAIGGGASTIYIVPSDSEDVLLTLNEQTAAVPVYSYFRELIYPGRDSGELTTEFTTLVEDGGFAWIE
ncbi:MAG: hypothetical protein JAY88_02560 [Candidatus Thiodiazotropha lotti]|nr:hypothetical protein [Candidatus Thiodiazotropha lotti]MCW4185948.1 hypothetical protein [Candidatus Thiodiazotropha lotti]